MIYKIYTGGHPIRAFLEFIASIFIPAAMLGGIVELFELDKTYIGQDKTLSIVFGLLGFLACVFVYQYIISKFFRGQKEQKDI